MLISLDGVKGIADTIATVNKNVSSILSKVNNLGSQKTLGFVRYGTGTCTYTGKGVALIGATNVTTPIIEGYIDGSYINSRIAGSDNLVWTPIFFSGSINLSLQHYASSLIYIVFTYR